MTGFASIETAINATKKGVFHYLTKPFELEDLYQLIIKACKKLGFSEDAFANQPAAQDAAGACLVGDSR